MQSNLHHALKQVGIALLAGLRGQPIADGLGAKALRAQRLLGAARTASVFAFAPFGGSSLASIWRTAYGVCLLLWEIGAGRIATIGRPKV